ncbi:dTDP-4-dehydrorhamnose reductase [Yoonia sp. TsM2_T14_4]|uniref:dTDP-4-dehydrorhamnose reductase n=1 Tax=Yoonia sp. TsM2_T14_4 TaxID=3415141 RepID=UPI003C75E243
MMHVLVFGQTGQVATALAQQTCADITITCLGRDRADLTDTAACAAIIAQTHADVVINAAAYTAVDRAESEPDLARAINATAPAAMARACAARKIPFLHISTDYVFGGSGSRPWQVDDPTGPLGIYGQTKLAGEDAVRAAAGAHVILRTSWVFSAHGANFVKTMLRLGAMRPDINVVADQHGGPTAADDIAAALISIARAFHTGRGISGTYHFSGSPDVSWAGFARTIFASAGIDCAVQDIPTSAYPTPAARPANSRLDCSALARDYAIAQPDWQGSLRHVLQSLQGERQ